MAAARPPPAPIGGDAGGNNYDGGNADGADGGGGDAAPIFVTSPGQPPMKVKTVFYLNVVVLNPGAVVAAKVREKIPHGLFGLMQKGAVSLAQRAVQDDTVSAEVANGLVAMVPASIARMGIDVSVARRFVGGPLCVLRCQLRGADAVQLLRGAKGDEHAAHLAAMQAAFAFLGIDAAAAALKAKMFAQTKATLMEKLVETLPEKLREAGGVEVEVFACEEEDEAEFFFSFMEGRKARTSSGSSK